MYNHVNDRSGLESPLIADDVYEIIMKVIFLSKFMIWCTGNVIMFLLL